MNPQDALRLMIDNYPGGRAVIAARLGKTEEVLRKETCGSPSHKLGLNDAVTVSDMCIEIQSPHCYAFVNAIAGRAGQLVALPVREMATKQDIRTNMAGMLKECSDTFGVVTQALADERINDNELRHIKREGAELLEKVQAVIQASEARNLAGKPSFLQAAA